MATPNVIKYIQNLKIFALKVLCIIYTAVHYTIDANNIINNHIKNIDRNFSRL